MWGRQTFKKSSTFLFYGAHDAKTTRLVGEIRNFEFIVTSSETESLLLELNLIKQYQPRYNILLKDDKSYPFIKITKEKHPRLLVTRTVKEFRQILWSIS